VWTAVCLICLQFGYIATHAAQGEQQPIVRIRSGLLEGIHFGSNPNGAAFLGIPYAASPIGDLRWKPPQPAPNWSGTRKADNMVRLARNFRHHGSRTSRARRTACTSTSG
jgi:carboxylesterase type B